VVTHLARRQLFAGTTGQGCGSGSGSGLDPDSATLWIRIRIGNPDPGARKLRNISGKMHFLVIFLKKFTIKEVLNITKYFLKF
jgi:hypothetical protein